MANFHFFHLIFKRLGIIEICLQKREVIFSDDVLTVVDVVLANSHRTLADFLSADKKS